LDEGGAVNPEGAFAPEEVGEALVMGACEVRPRGEERGGGAAAQEDRLGKPAKPRQ